MPLPNGWVHQRKSLQTERFGGHESRFHNPAAAEIRQERACPPDARLGVHDERIFSKRLK